MSATFAENSKQHSPEKTAEQAEEAMMETETGPVTTEQPAPADIPVNSSGGGASADVPGVNGVQGTPVEETTAAGAAAAGATTDQASIDTDTDTASIQSAATDAQSDTTGEEKELDASAAKVDRLVEDSTKSKAGEVNNSSEAEEKTDKEVEEEKGSFEEGNLEKTTSTSADRLEKLALQIDNFDVTLEPRKAIVVETDNSNGSDDSDKAFTGELTDDKIDELIEEASKVSDVEVGTPAEASEADKVLSEEDEGEVTPEVSNKVSNESKNDKCDSLSTVEVSENDAESRINGKLEEEAMTASTESDGFAEEKVANETAEQTPRPASTAPTPAIQDSGTKKADDKKTEHSSPVKTAKSKKKEDKSIEHILKALSSLQTTEEKLAALCKKYADLHEDHRVLQATSKQTQRKLTVISREKDQLQTEHTKAVMAKSKLESLCRELQKHNQTIRQESLQRAKEEDEKRKEISQKFQTTIGEIQQQMQENHDRNKQLREENFELANKLKKFIEQYEAREKQVEKVIQHRELEQKLADAKLEQAAAILMEEKTRSQKEREMLLLTSADSMKKIQLKDAELKMYKERYEEFQSTIKRSEEMFNKFKTEMDKMTKRCKKLDKETAQWKGKWENSNRALLEMAEEKQRYDKEKGLLMSKISKLESLCRAMQAERKARKMLENEGVDMSKLTLGESTPPLLEPQGAALEPGEAAPTPSPVHESHVPAASQLLEACGAGKSTIEDIDEDDDDDDSDLSSASETTGVTVIQPDSQAAAPPDTSQSECTTAEDSQSEETAKQVLDQSEVVAEPSSQSEGAEVTTAS